MRLQYTIKLSDERKIAKAIYREARVSPKHCVELCRELKGKKLDAAREYLSRVIQRKISVPFKRYNKKVGHRSDLVKWHSGRYPQKAAKILLELLYNAEANAMYKGLDIDRLYIKHICAKKGRKIIGYMPRAFSRATPWNEETTNIEVILEER